MRDAVPNFEQTRVLVLGDIMLDRYVWGKVSRISPEAPVPVVQVQRQSETLGGAGNVANNLVSLGCHTAVIALCGDDPTARTLQALLAQKQIAEHLIVDTQRPTITKTRIMAQKQQMLRLDEETAVTLPQALQARILTIIEEQIQKTQVVILSDYGKGFFFSEAFCQAIIATAHRQSVPILVDPKGNNWERYRGATCITPNTIELASVIGAALDENETVLIAAARTMRNQLDLPYLLVTRSAKGMCLIGPGDKETMIPAQAREVFDVSGAGDTVIATLAGCLATGVGMEKACAIANLAAGIVVGKLGTQPVEWSELASALHTGQMQNAPPFSSGKTVDLPAALDRAQAWKVAGASIVFTNGCFDLLHPGHLSLLCQARGLGDRLIVGLNSDASVKRLKGPGRPILNENDRAAMLSALACVDLVVHFDQDTPLALIEALQPDILVKGADYTIDQVVGRQIVESYGGCVKLVDVVQGYSTTGLTQKVLAGSQTSQ